MDMMMESSSTKDLVGNPSQDPEDNSSKDLVDNTSKDPVECPSHSKDHSASAPPIEENCFENEAYCHSPTDQRMKDPPPPYPTLTEEQARGAILQFVTEHCCYGKKPAQEMIIRSLESSSAFHYTLQSFVEKRETKWKIVPYHDYSHAEINGAEPSMWNVLVPTPADYLEGKCKTEVPNTSSVHICTNCLGIGRTSCYICMGGGRENCNSCGGRGRDINHRVCMSCAGCGQKTCSTCLGTGRVSCITCCGQGKLRQYKLLKCVWKNFVSDQVIEQTSLPVKLIRKVNGHVAFEEDFPQVIPVNNFPNQAVNAASEELVTKHAQEYSSNSDRILRQRHSIRIIPVTQVYYDWKDKNDHFFVLGHENKVHAPNYPHKCCCCGCSIL